MQTPIYMDNHSTTRTDPRVVEAMLPYFSDGYGNAASTTHPFGWQAKDAARAARESIASTIGAKAKEIVFTSGATESNNLAIRGLADHPRRRGSHLVSIVTEHPSVLDPLGGLERRDYDITLVGVQQDGSNDAGRVRIDEFEEAIRDDTLMVSVMLANNEIGVIQPLADIAEVCRRRSVLLHCDATQAVGKIPIDVRAIGIDLMSLSAHKFYGPKGVGALYFRRGGSHIRMQAQLLGGGHEAGLRSGTLNVPGIIGMAKALELSVAEMDDEAVRLQALRRLFWDGLVERVEGVSLNGPAIDEPELRLAGNLNVRFDYVDGEALLMSVQNLALSSGSACTSAVPESSHVLRAMGLTEVEADESLRFSLGRNTTKEDVVDVVRRTKSAVQRVRDLMK